MIGRRGFFRALTALAASPLLAKLTPFLPARRGLDIAQIVAVNYTQAFNSESEWADNTALAHLEKHGFVRRLEPPTFDIPLDYRRNA